MLRRVAPLLLLAGAVLLAAVLVWPTQHLVSRGVGGSEPLVDIWFSGRVRGLTDQISAAAQGSAGLVALVCAALVLLLASGVVWVAASARGAAAQGGGAVPRGPVVVAAALAVVALAALAVAFAGSGSGSFGWFATVDLGTLEIERTAVALFLPAAGALTALAVIAMLVVVAGRRVTT